MQVLNLRDTRDKSMSTAPTTARWDTLTMGTKTYLLWYQSCTIIFCKTTLQTKQSSVTLNTKTAFFDRAHWEWKRIKRERRYRKYLTAASIIVVSLGDLWPTAAIHKYRLSLTDYPNYSYFPTISHGPCHYLLPRASSLLTEKSFDLLDVPPV